MKLCLKCGAGSKDAAKFCSKCGTPWEKKAWAPPAAEVVETEPPQEQEQEPEPETINAGPFNLDKYLFNQKIFTIREQYYIFDEYGNEVFYVRRKLFALKRHFTFFYDRSMSQEALIVKQKQFIEIFTKTYDVLTPEGELVGRLKRRWLISIFRRTWAIFNANGQKIGVAHEDSWFMAFVRRFIVQWKVDFIFEIGGREIGRFVRRITLIDKYALDLTPDTENLLDRRLALAMGVLMDAEENR